MAIQNNFPAIKPTLLLDFANTDQLDPRITFTRASTATYYGTETAKAEENLLLFSQEFDNAGWTKVDVTVSANLFTAPDGTTTAETVVESVSTNPHRIQATSPQLLASTRYVFSVFVKDVDRQFVSLSVTGALNNFFGATYDLTNGIVTSTRQLGTGFAHVSSTMTSFGNGWYRLVLVGDAGTTVNNSSFNVSLSTNGTPTVDGRGTETYLGSSKSICAWGAQLEQRSAVTNYTPTTTQPITNYIPVLESAASGVARFDHNPTTFESLGLLIEESRTNLLLRSEEFDNAAWTKIRTSITANTVIAPDGTLTGDKVVEDTATGAHNIACPANISFVAGASQTLSIFVKKAGRSFVQLSPHPAALGNSFANFDLTSGIVTTSTNCTAQITNVGGGWFRCAITYVAAFTITTRAGFFTLLTSGNAPIDQSYLGNGFDGLFFWGAQFEQAAFATSYIPTVASQVTRAADAASMTGANFSSWYNQAAGTLYGELSGISYVPNQRWLSINDGGTANRILAAYAANTTNIGFIVQASGVVGISTSVLGASNPKIAFAVATNNFAYSQNGALSATGSSVTVPLVTRLQFGNAEIQPGTCTIRKLSYYPLRLSNTNLQALTS